MRENFKKHIAIPQDHGAWVFILSPLLVGAFAGGRFTPAVLTLSVAAMSAFMLRQPTTVFVKALSGRRPKTDLPPARFWILIYSIIASLALLVLVAQRYAYLLYLAIPGAPVFAWHLWLVGKKAERKQAGIEIIATGVLSLAAPAAYWATLGGYNPQGWQLWVWTWLQSAASIVYAYLRLEQRELPQDRAYRSKDLWKMGNRAFLYTSFNLVIAALLGGLQVIPQFLFVPFLVQWLETLWGIFRPAIGWKPTRIGVRQLVVSVVWTVLFIVSWRL